MLFVIYPQSHRLALRTATPVPAITLPNLLYNCMKYVLNMSVSYEKRCTSARSSVRTDARARVTSLSAQYDKIA